MIRRLFILPLLLSLSIFTFGQTGEYLAKENIPYYDEAVRNRDAYIAERCVLDIYYPAQIKDFATIVWFHGGGLTGGSKHIPHELKDKGFCVVAVNYRLSPKVNCPKYIEDAAAAVNWVFSNIEKYGGDSRLIFISGHSAGAYLTFMVGLDKRWLEPYQIDPDRIAALLPLSGHTITHSTIRKEQGISNIQPLVDEYAPVFYVRADAPPTILMTGDRELEMLGRYEENAYMLRMMKLAGHTRTVLHEFDGYGHDMLVPAFPLVVKYVNERIEEIRTQVVVQNINFSGKVHDGSSGIAEVAVTDGTNITHTDANGQYKLLSNASTEFAYITLPSGYEIPIKNGTPCFYVPFTDKSKPEQTIDFELKKSARDDYRHTMIAWADPQIYYEEELPLAENAAKDVEALNKQSKVPVFGVVCGDIVGDHPEHYEPLKKILASTGVPFFFAAGNHDMTLNVRSNDLSKDTFKKTFGPDYYSFNRGKIHYVVLDDVFYVGRTYWYIAYLPEKQLAWLQQDLASVPDGSTVVVILHIPTSTHETQAQENMSNVLQNRQHLHEMLKPYNAHIFSGHMHYNDNFVIADNLYEHVHAAVCAEFWQTPQCSDGTPQGYGVYEINGDDIQWYYKSVGFDKNFQFRAYPVGANPEKPAAITANVWNYDPQWKVNWYENDAFKGEMTQFRGHDPYSTDYIVKNKHKFRYDWISTGATNHLFFAEPSSPDAKIKIEVIDRFGNKFIEDLK